MTASLPHPGRTPAQRRVLDEIGCGNASPMMARSTRQALLDAGLIVELSPRVEPAGRFLVEIARYDMPVSVHMQWCSAVAEGDLPDDLLEMTDGD